jgi:hypothetical protein
MIEMKKMIKMITGAAVFAAALAGLRRFGPAIHERAMKKCHQMMGKCREMLGQQAGTSADTACVSAATPVPEPAAAAEHERAEAVRAS